MARSGVQLTVTRGDGGNVLVCVRGELTVGTCGLFRLRLRPVVHACDATLVVDLSEVDDIDPAGIAVLLVYARSMRCLGQDLMLVNAGSKCRKILALVGARHLLSPS